MAVLNLADGSISEISENKSLANIRHFTVSGIFLSYRMELDQFELILDKNIFDIISD